MKTARKKRKKPKRPGRPQEARRIRRWLAIRHDLRQFGILVVVSAFVGFAIQPGGADFVAMPPHLIALTAAGAAIWLGSVLNS